MAKPRTKTAIVIVRRKPPDVVEGDLVRLLEFIEDYWGDHGHAPTNRELAQGLGLSSPSVAWYWVQAAKAKGYATSTPHARTLQLTFYGRKLLADFASDDQLHLKARIAYHSRRAVELGLLLRAEGRDEPHPAQ